MSVKSLIPVLVCALLTGFVWLGECRAQDEGQKLYEARCQKCHELAQPKDYTGAEWGKLMERMAGRFSIKPDEREKILSFLVAHSKDKAVAAVMTAEQQLFEAKCSRCHTLERIYREKLTPQGRAHIAFRMREKDPTWISENEAKQIADFLAKLQLPERVEPVARQDAATLFDVKCGTCHTLERVFAKTPTVKDWKHIVSRMQEKSPEWIKPEEADLILGYLKKLSPPKTP
jgi:cytochrome c2